VSPSASGIAAAVAAGMGLGALYFGSLWLTVHRLSSLRRPVLVFVGSFLLRTTVVVAGIYLVARSHWQLFLACVAGVVVARTVLVRVLVPREVGGRSGGQETACTSRSGGKWT